VEIKELRDKLSDFVRKNANPRGIALVLGALTLIAFLSFILIKGRGEDNFAVLYTHLSPDDAGEILTVLQEEKIPYKVVGDGSIILVPKDKVYDVRLKLAAKGLPHGKVVGFELFDKPKLGITQFQENVEYLRALEGELERTIRQIDAVRDVKVNIALPRDSIFVRSTSEPKASVLIDLWPGRDLTKEQVKAIVFLVSHAVPGLKPENVTVVDNRGRVLTDLLENQDSERPTKELLIKRQLERDIEDKVRTLLSRVLGSNKVVVSASVEVETGKFQQKRELYNPDLTAVVSERKVQERETTTEKLPQGAPGTPTNVPPVINNQSQGQVVKKEKRDITTNYDVSKTVEETKAPIFKIKRITVGVLIDGKYKEVKEKNGTVKYEFVPRPEKELKIYEEIVKSAIGYDPKRGDVVRVASVPFERSLLTPKEGNQTSRFPWYYLAIGVLVGGSLLLLIALKVLKGRKKEVKPEVELSEALLAEMKARSQHKEEIESLDLTKDPAYLKIIEIGKDYPEIITSVVSKWLRER